METPPPSPDKSTADSPEIGERELQDMEKCYKHVIQLLAGALTTAENLRQEKLCLEAEKLQLEREVAQSEETWKSGIKSVSDFDSAGGSGSGSKVKTGSGSGSAGMGSDKAKRGTSPKSISIRSIADPHPTPGGAHPTPPALQGENETGEVERVVYYQGTEKTELCNKWEETGSCPYNDRCRFAHGMEEMKPVIRHPRYKTELCRMMVSGGSCRYGHRCQFRH